ncbi:MAG TPA: hypothetical protein VMW63_00750, partial [Methanoregulaceae archaeon]|nr:hypothetical protein [Methanoregulaceae archaeon]
QEQSNANIRNMERNMIVLQNEINGLTYKNIPYQETTLQVSGGTLMVDQDPGTMPYFEIKMPMSTDPYPSPNPIPFYLGKLEFLSDDGTTVIVLENGAVHKRYWSDPTGSVMIAEPRWFLDDDTFVMSFIRINATNDMAQTGIGTVSMMITDSSEEIYDLTASGNAVKVTYNADFVDNYNIAWRNYFNSPELMMIYDLGDSNGFKSVFSLDNNIDYVVIKTYNITVLSL